MSPKMIILYYIKKVKFAGEGVDNPLAGDRGSFVEREGAE